MLDFTTIAELSRHHCVSICAFLVPANLVLTSLTLWCVARSRFFIPLPLAASVASIFALSLFLHVGSWFIVGVVRVPTFILLTLGFTCMAINFYALREREKFQQYLHFGWQFLVERFRSRFAREF